MFQYAPMLTVVVALIGTPSAIGGLTPKAAAKHILAGQGAPIVLAATDAEVKACKEECKKQEKACKDSQPLKVTGASGANTARKACGDKATACKKACKS